MQEWIVIDQFGNMIAQGFMINDQQNFMRKLFQTLVLKRKASKITTLQLTHLTYSSFSDIMFILFLVFSDY